MCGAKEQTSFQHVILLQQGFSNWTKIKTLHVSHQSNALRTNLLTVVHKWYQLCYCQGEKSTFISLFTEAVGS